MINCENQSCNGPSENHNFHSCIKHIATQHHSVEEKLMNEKFTLICYPTNKMIANVLIKKLLQDKHNIDYLLGFGTYSLIMLLILEIKVV